MERKFYLAFEAWCLSEIGIGLCVLGQSGILLGVLLKGYGRYLFNRDEPLYVFSETINAVGDYFREYKPFLAPAWRTLSVWESAEPSDRRMTMPANVLLAAVTVSFSWKWFKFGALLLLGFSAMLRPAFYLGTFFPLS